MEKINVGILGATGTVGQNYISLLRGHPWFTVSYVAASPASAGKSYAEAVRGRWHAGNPLPETVSRLIVGDANEPEQAIGKCAFVFSALELEKDSIKKLEERYAALDIPVVSNSSAHRFTEDVPLLIPEVNAEHLDMIAYQRNRRGWRRGFIVV